MTMTMKLSNAVNITRGVINSNLNNAQGSWASYLIPMFWSLPGEGKSTAIKDLVAEMGGHLITVIPAQFDAGELGGFPYRDGEAMLRARPFFLPTEEEAAQHKFVCLFLDELPQAPKANQNVVAQLVNERRVGEHILPDNVVVVCAGNPLVAQAGTTAMPTHLRDRLLHLHIETDHQGFRDYALSNDFSPVITTYIQERPEWLQKFDTKSDACPSPRSWERVNTILEMGLEPAEEMFAIAGQIGEGATADFVGYKKIWTKVPKAEAILADPKGHSIPSDPSIMYALCSNLAHKANKSNIKEIITYVERFTNKEFTAFCMKDAIKRNPELKTEKVVTDWFFTSGKELMM